MRDIMLMIHFTGVAMFIGTFFAYTFLEISNGKQSKEAQTAFSLKLHPLNRMGHIGLALLLLSGGYLMTPYWKILSNAPLLISKLSLVVLVTVLIGIMGYYAKKATKGDAETYFKKLEPYSIAAFFVGLAIIILAVLNFH